MRLSLVLPCFNEEGNIAAAVRDALRWMRASGIGGEVIVVDDGSGDRSPEILARLQEEDPRVRVVRHPENRGYGAALTTGLDAARGDPLAFMDSDGQFRAEDFDRLLPHVATHAFVAGYRVHRADPLPRIINALLYGALLRLLLALRVRDPNCAMKVFRAELWPRLRPASTGALFNAELFAKLKWQGIPWMQVPVPHYPRLSGRQTGAKVSVILRMFGEMRELRRRLAGSARSPETVR